MKLNNKQPTLIGTVSVAAMLSLMQLGLLSASQAQEDGAALAAVQDEVTVFEEKSIRQLRRELDTAEKDFFSVFNGLLFGHPQLFRLTKKESRTLINISTHE